MTTFGVFWRVAAGLAAILLAWLLILASVVFCGPVLTIGALLFLLGLAAWRGRGIPDGARRTDHRYFDVPR